MALLSMVSSTWVSEDQFESETFLLDKDLCEDEYFEFLGNWLKIRHQLGQLASLEENWDGDGASPLDEAIIESVECWFDSLQHAKTNAPTRIVADPDGAVVVEWLEADSYYEVEFSVPYKGEWMFRHKDEEARHGEFDLAPQFAFGDDTISGTESHPVHGSLNDTTLSSSEYQDVYAASA